MHQSGSFHHFPRSVARRFLPSSLWNALRHWVRRVRVALALRELTGEISTEVLPALQNLFSEGPQLSGPVKKAIRKFIAMQQFSGRPVALHWL